MTDKLKQALFEHMITDPTITAFVGSRVFPNAAPQTAPFPYITYERLDSEHFRHSLGSSGLAKALPEIDCWDTDSVVAEQIANRVRLRFHQFQGQMGNIALQVDSSTCEGMKDAVKQPENASDPTRWVVSVDLSVWYRETIT